MSKSRASKGLLVEPNLNPNFSKDRQDKWHGDAAKSFASPSAANKEYYSVLLKALWPDGHGIPGPILTQDDLRAAIDQHQANNGKSPYKDVFRRVRELQGEEGFTCIIKEGVKYQLKSLDVSSKREPRAKPSKKLWDAIRSKYAYRCAHCGQQEPNVKLSPDHRVPRARGGSNDEENWQPLCEQCNNIKSSSCSGCQLNCFTCHWAYPETYKPIVVDDDNREQIKRLSEKKGAHQSELVNEILRNYFSAKQ